VNRWQYIEYFYSQSRDRIMATPRNEWAIDAYAWEPYMQMTPIEQWLWGDMRNAGAVFYPQWPIDGFFVDFANPVAKVAIECDGAAYHQDKAKDAARDDRLEALGWRVYRITGSDCWTEEDMETGERGYARRFIDEITDRHGLKRQGKPGRVHAAAACFSLIDHLYEANGI
jgi:very-short-patch-repair endonuclease